MKECINQSHIWQRPLFGVRVIFTLSTVWAGIDAQIDIASETPTEMATESRAGQEIEEEACSSRTVSWFWQRAQARLTFFSILDQT